MWNPSALQNRAAAQQVHTVRARWGSRPGTIDMGAYSLPWAGYAPDWHVLTIRHDPSDRAYPFFVTGWLPVAGTDGATAAEPFCWRVPCLTDARYDLTEAVAITVEA